MGRASLINKNSNKYKSSEKECLNKKIKIDKKNLFQGVSVGNPHCVIFQKKYFWKDANFMEKKWKTSLFPKRF